MRATINFDVDAERVPQTMRSLILEEAYLLNAAIAHLEEVSIETLGGDLNKVLTILEGSLHQLHQYKNMLVGFERARLEVPDNAGAGPEEAPVAASDEAALAEHLASIQGQLKEMTQIDEFLTQMRADVAEISPPQGVHHDAEEG